MKKTAEMSTVKTGLKISKSVTNETSDNFKALVEATCAIALNPAELSTPIKNNQPKVGIRGVSAKANNPSNDNENKVTRYTTTIGSPSYSVLL